MKYNKPNIVLLKMKFLSVLNQIYGESMKAFKRGLFIDDTRDLTTPSVLRDLVNSGTLDIEWHLVRSTREMRHNEVFLGTRFDYVCFDFYLDERGNDTGLDAIYVLHDYYQEMGWRLPAASFHSSDDTCNKRMAREWGSIGGTFIDVKDDPNNLAKKAVLAHSSGGRTNDPGFSPSVFGRDIEGTNRVTYGVKKTGKGVKRKGGRP